MNIAHIRPDANDQQQPVYHGDAWWAVDMNALRKVARRITMDDDMANDAAVNAILRLIENKSAGGFALAVHTTQFCAWNLQRDARRSPVVYVPEINDGDNVRRDARRNGDAPVATVASPGQAKTWEMVWNDCGSPSCQRAMRLAASRGTEGEWLYPDMEAWASEMTVEVKSLRNLLAYVGLKLGLRQTARDKQPMPNDVERFGGPPTNVQTPLNDALWHTGKEQREVGNAPGQSERTGLLAYSVWDALRTAGQAYVRQCAVDSVSRRAGVAFDMLVREHTGG